MTKAEHVTRCYCPEQITRVRQCNSKPPPTQFPDMAIFYVTTQPVQPHIYDDAQWHKVVAEGYTDDSRTKYEINAVKLALECNDKPLTLSAMAWVKKDSMDTALAFGFTLNAKQ